MTRKKSKVSKKKNIFRGADDIYLTKKNIAVRRVSSYTTKKGRFVLKDKTTYIPKTEKNLRRAKAVHGYIRNGR